MPVQPCKASCETAGVRPVADLWSSRWSSDPHSETIYNLEHMQLWFPHLSTGQNSYVLYEFIPGDPFEIAGRFWGPQASFMAPPFPLRAVETERVGEIELSSKPGEIEQVLAWKIGSFPTKPVALVGKSFGWGQSLCPFSKSFLHVSPPIWGIACPWFPDLFCDWKGWFISDESPLVDYIRHPRKTKCPPLGGEAERGCEGQGETPGGCEGSLSWCYEPLSYCAG